MTAVTDRRRLWVASLARLCRPMGADAATVALTAMLPLLADLPDEAFCAASLEVVARSAKGVPAYAALRSALAAWCRDHPELVPTREPSCARLAGPDRSGWSETDRQWYDYWQTRYAEGFAPLAGFSAPRRYECAGPDAVSQMRAHAASLVRTHSPRAWAAIVTGQA